MSALARLVPGWPALARPLFSAPAVLAGNTKKGKAPSSKEAKNAPKACSATLANYNSAARSVSGAGDGWRCVLDLWRGRRR